MEISNIDVLKDQLELINSIDWDMTPEEAIALHLEWGPLRDQAYYNSRDNDNETVYFVVDTWRKPPIVNLIRRIGFDSQELYAFRLPQEIEDNFMGGIGKHRGVYELEDEMKAWLKQELE